MSAIDYSGKVVIITGSSSGIGQAAAILFAKSGASVTIHGRSEDGLKKTTDLILAAGVPKERIHFVIGCLSDKSVLTALIDETVQKFGRIDVLINNAAGGLKPGEENPRSMENFDYVFDVNVKSAIFLTEDVIPHLEKTKGNIINISNVLNFILMPQAPFYIISKGTLDHFARNYAALLAPKGIRINNLSPGATETGVLTRYGPISEAIVKQKENIASMVPLKRWAMPEELGEFMLFMASDKASYMTGQIINVDGGFSIISPSIKFD
uniref:Uncharacterized protein n=1 Tax=Panagrolaimus sp. ES5 TaxID=591445 RepID=A0AC34FZ71_9BILA